MRPNQMWFVGWHFPYFFLDCISVAKKNLFDLEIDLEILQISSCIIFPLQTVIYFAIACILMTLRGEIIGLVTEAEIVARHYFSFYLFLDWKCLVGIENFSIVWSAVMIDNNKCYFCLVARLDSMQNLKKIAKLMMFLK